MDIAAKTHALLEMLAESATDDTAPTAKPAPVPRGVAAKPLSETETAEW